MRNKNRSRRAPRVAAVACLTLAPRAAADPSTRRPRPTRSRPRGRGTAASSTWPSTRGSATRPTPTSSGQSRRSSSGCTVNYKELKEDVSWQGFGTGEVDVVIEDWGHPDLEKKFFAEQAVTAAPWTSGRPATSASSAGTSRRGSPRSTRTSSTGRTSTSTPRSSRRRRPATRASSSAPTRRTSSTTRRSSSNLDLDFKVVFSGSEAASITAFQQAEENKEFMIGYFYEPQWLLRRAAAGEGRAAAVRGGLRGRPGRGRLRLPGDRAEEDRLAPRGPRSRRPSTWCRTSRGPTRTRTSSPSTSPPTACLPRTPPPSGSRRTRTRSTPGCLTRPSRGRASRRRDTAADRAQSRRSAHP